MKVEKPEALDDPADNSTDMWKTTLGILGVAILVIFLVVSRVPTIQDQRDCHTIYEEVISNSHIASLSGGTNIFFGPRRGGMELVASRDLTDAEKRALTNAVEMARQKYPKRKIYFKYF